MAVPFSNSPLCSRISPPSLYHLRSLPYSHYLLLFEMSLPLLRRVYLPVDLDHGLTRAPAGLGDRVQDAWDVAPAAPPCYFLAIRTYPFHAHFGDDESGGERGVAEVDEEGVDSQVRSTGYWIWEQSGCLSVDCRSLAARFSLLGVLHRPCECEACLIR